jgi:hypothetical protein
LAVRVCSFFVQSGTVFIQRSSEGVSAHQT